MVGDWTYMFKCDECEFLSPYWDRNICPKCGDKKSIYYNPNAAYGWKPVVARYVNKFDLLRPSTWKERGYYEIKESE